MGHENAHVTFQFNFYDFGAFQIGFVHTNMNTNGGQMSTLLDERIRWERDKPPAYVLLEIDGTIVQEDLRNTILKVTQVKKEKLH